MKVFTSTSADINQLKSRYEAKLLALRGKHELPEAVTFDWIIEALSKYDPTTTKTYLEWIITRLTSGKALWNDLYRLVIDEDKNILYLEKYDSLKRKLPQDKRNINNIETFSELASLIDEKLGLAETTATGDILGKYSSEPYAHVCFNSKELLVIQPIVHETAKFWSKLDVKSPSWCTVNKPTYQGYMKDGYILIVIDKLGGMLGDGIKAKYQFYVPFGASIDKFDSSFEFKDKDDLEISGETVNAFDPLIKNLRNITVLPHSELKDLKNSGKIPTERSTLYDLLVNYYAPSKSSDDEQDEDTLEDDEDVEQSAQQIQEKLPTYDLGIKFTGTRALDIDKIERFEETYPVITAKGLELINEQKSKIHPALAKAMDQANPKTQIYLSLLFDCNQQLNRLDFKPEEIDFGFLEEWNEKDLSILNKAVIACSIASKTVPFAVSTNFPFKIGTCEETYRQSDLDDWEENECTEGSRLQGCLIKYTGGRVGGWSICSDYPYPDVLFFKERLLYLLKTNKNSFVDISNSLYRTDQWLLKLLNICDKNEFDTIWKAYNQVNPKNLEFDPKQLPYEINKLFYGKFTDVPTDPKVNYWILLLNKSRSREHIPFTKITNPASLSGLTSLNQQQQNMLVKFLIISEFGSTIEEKRYITQGDETGLTDYDKHAINRRYQKYERNQDGLMPDLEFGDQCSDNSWTLINNLKYLAQYIKLDFKQINKDFYDFNAPLKEEFSWSCYLTNDLLSSALEGELRCSYLLKQFVDYAENNPNETLLSITGDSKTKSLPIPIAIVHAMCSNKQLNNEKFTSFPTLSDLEKIASAYKIYKSKKKLDQAQGADKKRIVALGTSIDKIGELVANTVLTNKLKKYLNEIGTFRVALEGAINMKYNIHSRREIKSLNPNRDHGYNRVLENAVVRLMEKNNVYIPKDPNYPNKELCYIASKEVFATTGEKNTKRRLRLISRRSKNPSGQDNQIEFAKLENKQYVLSLCSRMDFRDIPNNRKRMAGDTLYLVPDELVIQSLEQSGYFTKGSLVLKEPVVLESGGDDPALAFKLVLRSIHIQDISGAIAPKVTVNGWTDDHTIQLIVKSKLAPISDDLFKFIVDKLNLTKDVSKRLALAGSLAKANLIDPDDLVHYVKTNTVRVKSIQLNTSSLDKDFMNFIRSALKYNKEGGRSYWIRRGRPKSISLSWMSYAEFLSKLQEGKTTPTFMTSLLFLLLAFTGHVDIETMREINNGNFSLEDEKVQEGISKLLSFMPKATKPMLTLLQGNEPITDRQISKLTSNIRRLRRRMGIQRHTMPMHIQ